MRVFLITEMNYPGGDAGGTRYKVFADMCAALGNNINICCLGKDKEKVAADKYNAVSFYDSSPSKLKKLLTYFRFPKLSLNELKKYDDVAAVIWSGFLIPHNYLKLKKYCEKKGIKLIYNADEWYSPEEFKTKLNPDYMLNSLMHNRFIPGGYLRCISISRYLQKHFDSINVYNRYIPAVQNVSSIPCVKTERDDKLRIIYAGSPTRKDMLAPVITAAANLSGAEMERTEITIIGATEDQLINISGVPASDIEKLGSHLTVSGRVPKSEVLEAYSKADFSVLIRPENMRYAMAGFPTKFVESLSSGTPVICNLTSDLADFLTDGENGLVVRGEAWEDVIPVLRRALSLSAEDKKQMSASARKTAEEKLDYHCWLKAMSELIEG